VPRFFDCIFGREARMFDGLIRGPNAISHGITDLRCNHIDLASNIDLRYQSLQYACWHILSLLLMESVADSLTDNVA
jgi:hypothetical protein